MVSVKDGDTIEVLHNRKPERIRLSGIDCPEKKQTFGQRTKQATFVLSFGQDVSVHSTGKDRYGRTLGDVILPDGQTLDNELVKGGWCWWYRKYAPGNTVLEGLEIDTRKARIGLRVDPHPLSPREWRKRGSSFAGQN